MNSNQRPQGREKYVGSGESKGVHRRGEGLGTGPVGSGGPGGQGRGSGSGGQTRASGGGGRGGLIAIIVAAVVALGGGGGLMGLLGGSGGETAEEAALSGGTSSGYSSTLGDSFGSGSSAGSSGTVFNAFQSQLSASQSAAASGWASNANLGNLDGGVASGSRDKRTTILGGGSDRVTVMVYMCGTDLESRSSMGTNDLLEMTRARQSDNVNVVVLTGGCNKWNNQVVSASVNQIYEIASGGLRCVNDNFGTEPMTQPRNLTNFIQWCAARYPANRYELIFWDHGGGSVSGYGYDEKYPRSGSMSLAGINQALSDAGLYFDFIGFDACLMATVETGLMLDSYADYMIASEETEPGIGWYYTDWLTALADNSSMSTPEIGKNIVDSFISTCARECRNQSCTLSVVDLAELSNTAPAALKSFSESLSASIGEGDYAAISTARSGAREFARSSAIDQIDLVDFAQRLGTEEGAELSRVLRGAVKYNRVSSDMRSAYGLSIYFPYRKTSNVNTAINTYSAIGLDDSYSRAIREFASLELSGQVSTGGTSTSALPSLLGSFGGSSSGSAELISGLLGSFLSGGGADFFSGRAMSQEDTAEYISEHYFDASRLVWTQEGGETVLALPEDQWALVTGIDVNMFYDDGSGFVDLGLDNVYEFNDSGALLGETDGTWLAVNNQPVAFYHAYDETTDGVTRTYGTVPVLLNGKRAELLVVLEHGRGTVAGARSVYHDGETETVAKSLTELAEGDTVDFLCDYYSYDGEYLDTYYLGEQETWHDGWEIYNVPVGDGGVKVTWRFTDIYQQHYWTEPITWD